MTLDEPLREQSNEMTMASSRLMWERNATANRDVIRSLPDVLSLAGQFWGLPAVLVAPGPSLARSLPDLKALKGIAVIVAATQAIRTLTLAGVHPDLVVAVSGNEEISAHFEGAKEPFAMIASATVHPDAFRKTRNAKQFIFSCNGDDDPASVRELRPKISTVYAGGSVSTVAMSIAYSMGCNPLVLVGYDMAHGRGGEIYAEGSVEGGRRDPSSLVTVPANDGGTLLTPPDYFVHRSWISDAAHTIKERGGQVFNATEGGAVIDDTERATLPEATRDFPRVGVPVRYTISRCYRTGLGAR